MSPSESEYGIKKAAIALLNRPLKDHLKQFLSHFQDSNRGKQLPKDVLESLEQASHIADPFKWAVRFAANELHVLPQL